MTKSEELFERAGKLMPGGVNSPVRAFRSVGRTPFFVEKAKGAYLYDADGNRYLDYVCSWGPGILGHAVPSVVEAVQKACENGLTLRRAYGKRGGARAADTVLRPLYGNDASCQFRYGSGNECGACGQGLYLEGKK